jgi:hypothetical protein
MRKKTMIIAAIIAASVFFTFNVNAAPIIGYAPQQTWDAGANGWVDGPIDSTITVTHNAGGYLNMQVTGAIVPGYGLAIGSGDANFTGNFRTLADYDNSALSVKFDFITTGQTPNELGLYLQAGSGRQWAYDVLSKGTPAASGTTVYDIGIGSFSGWTPQNGAWTQADYYSDLSSVTWLGIYIRASGIGTEMYGLDNMYVTLVVPEPETVWMILAIVLSLGITFRGRLAEMVGQMKMRLHKA